MHMLRHLTNCRIIIIIIIITSQFPLDSLFLSILMGQAETLRKGIRYSAA